MDIRGCPNCGILFDFNQRIWTLNFGTVECPGCKNYIETGLYNLYPETDKHE